MRFSLTLFLLLPLAACMQSLEDGESSFVGNDVYAPGQPGYAQIHVGNHRYWTRHGTGLDELHFYTGIKPGEPLFPVNNTQNKDLAPWTARMTPNDIEELLARVEEERTVCQKSEKECAEIRKHHADEFGTDLKLLAAFFHKV
jgi:hypothetical protein